MTLVFNRKWEKSKIGPGFYSYEDGYFTAYVEKMRSTWKVRVIAEGRIRVRPWDRTMREGKKTAELIMDRVLTGVDKVSDWQTIDEYHDDCARSFLRGIAG